MMGLAVFAAAPPAHAQEPHYLHALSDLRTARNYIEFDRRNEYSNERRHAVEEIDKAISEIKRAAWDDGKNTQFAPPASMTDPWYPIHEAKSALVRARKNIALGIDTPQNAGLRDRALMHLDVANRILDDWMTRQGKK